jgi:predicted  nucleic acid-binding Zn-ribbon protein
MTIRVGKSFADLLNAMQQLSAGLSSSQDDPKQATYTKEIAALFENLRSLDERQEKAKSELYALSQEITEREKEARSLLGKVISYLESEYGKTGTELQRYGLSKRQFAASKTVKKPPVKV